ARVIAPGGVAAAHAAAERFRPLRRSAVREAVGDNGALCLFLQRVVADRLGGAHAFLDAAGLEDRALSIAGIGGPDSGIAIGLQLTPPLDLVSLCGADTLLRLLGLVERAFEVLDMMADLMGNDVGHGEIAGCPEALGQLVEEFGVDADLLVGRAVEWPHRRLRSAAARLVVVGVGDQCRRLILGAGLGEDLAPGFLRRAEHADEEGLRIGVELRWSRLAATRPAAAHPPQRSQSAIAEQYAQDADDPEAAADEAQQQAQATTSTAAPEAALAGPVFRIAAFGFGAQPHHRFLPRRLQCLG